MTLVKATLTDIPLLSQICKESYTRYFGDFWNEDGLDWYLNDQFNEQRLSKEISHPDFDFYFIMAKNQPIGFAKMAFNVSNELFVEASSELEKIYILPEYKGQGLGAKAIQELIAIAREKSQQILFLYALDSNQAAIRFYQKQGFQRHGTKQLNVPHFKDEFRGMERLKLML